MHIGLKIDASALTDAGVAFVPAVQYILSWILKKVCRYVCMRPRYAQCEEYNRKRNKSY